MNRERERERGVSRLCNFIHGIPTKGGMSRVVQSRWEAWECTHVLRACDNSRWNEKKREKRGDLRVLQ